MSGGRFGRSVAGLEVGGVPFTEGVFNEHEVRAAAGITLALGAIAFVYAYFAKKYVPIQAVTTFFFIEFAVRAGIGLDFSPVGLAARALARRQPPHWVPARPKRFAWGLGLAMAAAMTVITNAGIRGALPLSICLICLTLMWLEAVLGLCVGCEIHGLLARRGWLARDEACAACADGACIQERRP